MKKNRCNVTASIGKGNGLMLNGHMDTVPAGDGWKYDPFAAKIVDGKLYGRGSSDMKAGLAVMMIVAKELSKKNLNN